MIDIKSGSVSSLVIFYNRILSIFLSSFLMSVYIVSDLILKSRSKHATIRWSYGVFFLSNFSKWLNKFSILIESSYPNLNPV